MRSISSLIRRTAALALAAPLCLPLLAGAAESDNWRTVHPEWIWCDDFDQATWDTTVAPQYFEQDVGNGSLSRVAGVGLDGSTGVQIHFAAGQVFPGSLKVAFGKTPSSYFKPVDSGLTIYREIYWRLYLKNQSGWNNGVGDTGDKLSRALVMASSGWAEAAFGHCWGGPADNLELDPASGTDTAGNLLTTKYNDFAHMRWLGWAIGTTPIYDSSHVGTWRCIECHMKLNDAGAANGVLEMWIDGHLEGQRTGLNYLGSYSTYGINTVFFENYWNAGSPVAQDRFFDNFVVSTMPIGLIASGTTTGGSGTTGGTTSGSGTTTGGGTTGGGTTTSGTGSGSTTTGGSPIGGDGGGGHSSGCGFGTGSVGLLIGLLALIRGRRPGER